MDHIKLFVKNSDEKVIIDLPDYQLLPHNKFRFSEKLNRVIISYQKNTASLSRIVYKLHYEIHTRQQIGHKNGNPFDCRFSNLIILDHASAQWRSRRHAPHGYRGVGFNKAESRYTSQISYRKRDYYLGCFQTPIEAALMYNAAARFLFGEHANLNPVTQSQINFITNNRDRMIVFVQKVTTTELKVTEEFFDMTLKPCIIHAETITMDYIKSLI
jgi:hypothetical protein